MFPVFNLAKCPQAPHSFRFVLSFATIVAQRRKPLKASGNSNIYVCPLRQVAVNASMML